MTDPNTKTDYLVETSGNRHKAGAMRVKITITHRLTFDVGDAVSIAQALLEESVQLTPEQQEVVDFIKAQIQGEKKQKKIADSINFCSDNADLHNRLHSRRRIP